MTPSKQAQGTQPLSTLALQPCPAFPFPRAQKAHTLPQLSRALAFLGLCGAGPGGRGAWGWSLLGSHHSASHSFLGDTAAVAGSTGPSPGPSCPLHICAVKEPEPCLDKPKKCC